MFLHEKAEHVAKLLLVEDDNNLREIYQARLSAEGYEIVAAQNGEEALSLAKQERPDLIISDVMMPRISGFEMLDILRATPELASTKVIMLTALGQAEDQARAGKLGADKYLVKSQVTLEDIVNCAQDLLNGTTVVTPTLVATDGTAPSQPTTSTEPPVTASQQPISTPPVVNPAPDPMPPMSTSPVVATVVDPDPLQAPSAAPATVIPESQAMPSTTYSDNTLQNAITMPPTPITPTVTGSTDIPTSQATPPSLVTPVPEVTNQNVLDEAVRELMSATSSTPAPGPTPVAEPSFVQMPQPSEDLSTPHSPDASSAAEPTTTPAAVPEVPVAQTDTASVAGKKVIQPLNDITQGPDLNELLAREVAREQAGPDQNSGNLVNVVPTVAPPDSSASAETQTPENPPTQVPPTSPPAQTVDPNSIAL